MAAVTAPVTTPESPFPEGVTKEQVFAQAELQMEHRVEMFNKITSTCFTKCVQPQNDGTRYKESELNMGEDKCIDRCVSKYWQVTNLVGQLLGTQN